MQRRSTVGPGSQWPPFGNGSPEQFPNWARVRHCKGGKHGEVEAWARCVKWRVGGGEGDGMVVIYVWLSASTRRHFITKWKER